MQRHTHGNGEQAVVAGGHGILPAANETLGTVPIAAVYLLVVAVFGFDLVVPLGAGISFFYLVPVMFLALWSSPKQSLAVLRIAAFSAMLVGVGFVLSPPGDLWYAASNRSYALLVIGATVMLSVARKRAEEDIKVLHGLLPICCYCKKIRDDKGYWQQVERYIAARSEADFSHGMCPDCGAKHFPDIVAEPSRNSSIRQSPEVFGEQQ